MSTEALYVPAAGRRALTRLYDPVLALTTRERRFRGLLRDEVLRDLPSGGTAIDVGCGTGTFAIALAAVRPDAQVISVDGDAQVLALAQRKPGAAAVMRRRGLAGELPADDASADALVMSLLLHHVDPAGKRGALAEAVRVLRPTGRLHIADWGRPHDPLMRRVPAAAGPRRLREHARPCRRAAARLTRWRRPAGREHPGAAAHRLGQPGAPSRDPPLDACG